MSRLTMCGIKSSRNGLCPTKWEFNMVWACVRVLGIIIPHEERTPHQWCFIYPDWHVVILSEGGGSGTRPSRAHPSSCSPTSPNLSTHAHPPGSGSAVRRSHFCQPGPDRNGFGDTFVLPPCTYYLPLCLFLDLLSRNFCLEWMLGVLAFGYRLMRGCQW